MVDLPKPYRMIRDYITGEMIAEVGAEGNRQKVERLLVEQKGYRPRDIEVDAEIAFDIDGRPYRSTVDLVVSPDGGRTRFMVLKCVAGSLGSREREVVSAARLLDRYQIPLAVVSDGDTAIVMDTLSGEKIGEGLGAIPSREAAVKTLEVIRRVPYPPERLRRERLVFRTYDVENVNVARHLPPAE
ncbi:MAG TPA: type I restriction enzyme HsdR N-terminal domain-containing protein [Desulfobacterales bacterium]